MFHDPLTEFKSQFLLILFVQISLKTSYVFVCFQISSALVTSRF